MNNFINLKRIYIFILILFVTGSMILSTGCSGVNDMVKNAERLKFKLGSVDGFDIGGVKIKNFNSLSDLNILDGAKLLSAFSTGKLPTTFTVNLIAKNPDTYPGGTKESSSLIKGLDWRLLIDDKEVLAGEIDKTIEIPGVGKSVTIPIPIKIDFMELLNNGGYESLMNLALKIGGKGGSSSRLTLKIKPTLDIFMGGIIRPPEIDVIDKEFR